MWAQPWSPIGGFLSQPALGTPELEVPTSPGGPEWDWWKEADILGSEPLTTREKAALNTVALRRSEKAEAAADGTLLDSEDSSSAHSGPSGCRSP